MSQTRAMTARLGRIADLTSRHPQAIQAFSEGVGSVLRMWTALELAIHHQWGGPQSSDRAEALINEIVELFLGPEKIYKDDVALLLEDYLDVNFSTICEDGSPEEIGELFCNMWRQCTVGNYEIVTNVLSKEFVRSEMVTKSEGLVGGDAEDDEDSEDGDREESENNLKEALAAGLAEAGMSGLESIAEGDTMETEETEAAVIPATVEVPPIPIKDPDGWETVAKGKKSKKKA